MNINVLLSREPCFYLFSNLQSLVGVENFALGVRRLPYL